MTIQDGAAFAAPIGPTLDELIGEIQGAEAGQAYRDACVERMRCTIQLAALAARNYMVAEITREGFHAVLTAPAAGPFLAAGLQAADAESKRLLVAIGVDLDQIERGEADLG
jgi:hypothetical protein